MYTISQIIQACQIDIDLVINYVEELLKKSSTSCKKATAYVNKIGTCVGELEICEMKR